MKTRPLSTSIAALLYAPDTEGAPAGGATPPAAPPTPAPAPKTSPEKPTAPPAKPTQTLKAEPKIKGVLSVSKALKLAVSPKKENDLEAAAIMNRSRADTIIELPEKKAKEGEEDDDTATPPPIKKPEAREPEGTPPAEPTAPPVKVKIAGKEMTQEEAEEYVSNLEKKAAAAAAPPPAPKVEQTPEQKAQAEQKKAAEEKQKDDEFLTTHAQAIAKSIIASDPKRFDRIIGDGNIEDFSRLLAERELATRKWAEDQFNKAFDDLYRMATPGYETHQQIQRYTAETTFLEDKVNADLIPYRGRLQWADEAMKTKYPEEYAKLSPAERVANAAANVRNLIKEIGLAPDPTSSTPPNAAPPKPAAAPPQKPPKPAPPTGNLGGTAAPVKTTQAGSLISRLESHKRNS